MDSILAVPEGLPPGLWVPTAEEDTAQYLRENFNHGHHDYEDVVDYGAFVVALALYNRSETGRVCMMPRTRDFNEMFDAGYGLRPDGALRDYYGGIKKLQRSLGFYPRDDEPTRQELMERFEWLAAYGYVKISDEPKRIIINQVVEWASARRLIPSSDIVYKILGGNTEDVRKLFGLETRNALVHSSDMAVYRLGARILSEYGRPIKRDEMDRLYGKEFIFTPSRVIKARFGTYTNFWREFDYVVDAHGLTKQNLLILGIRWAIQNGRCRMQRGEHDDLSSQRKFISRMPMLRKFGSPAQYWTEVNDGYQTYLRQKDAFQQRGVDERVFRAFCRNYQPSPEFVNWLNGHIDLMITLSLESPSSRYILALINRGFNLLDEDILELQLKDLIKSLNKLGLSSQDDTRRILEVIPRVNADEILGENSE